LVRALVCTPMPRRSSLAQGALPSLASSALSRRAENRGLISMTWPCFPPFLFQGAG
jgi:hypothetical protein